MMQQPSLQLLAGLLEKYRSLLRLRRETTAAAPREELRRLARAYPGALRELDQLPLEALAARLSALEDVVDRQAAPAEWMSLQVSYHGFMRAALRIKGWSRDWPDDPAAALRELAARYVPAPDEPALSFFDPGVLAQIRRPVRGRLNPFVLEAVARHHATTADVVVRALLA